MEDPFAAPSSSGGLGVPKAHKPTLSVLLRDTDLPEQAEGESVDLPSVPALRHELFTGDEFDTSDFLLGRRHVALEELRSEVRWLGDSSSRDVSRRTMKSRPSHKSDGVHATS